MQWSNANKEMKTLKSKELVQILQILESGTLNESVRSNLSDKKKIKDLFLVVVRSIDVAKNKEVAATLV